MEYLVEPDDDHFNPSRPYETKQIYIAKQFPAYQRNQIQQPKIRRRCNLCNEFASLSTRHTWRCKQNQTELDLKYILESSEFDDIAHTKHYSLNYNFRQFVRKERLYERTLVIPAVVERIENRIKKAIEEELCTKTEALYTKE